MDATLLPDLATRQRILRRVIGQAYALVVILLIIGLAVTQSGVPLWVRAVATLVVLLVGVGLVEIFVRITARRYPSMRLPALANLIGATIGSLIGFGVALSVQRLLGYDIPITWVTLMEALISAPIWLVFVGIITTARWRYLTLRESLRAELMDAESARAVERDALTRARESVAESVRPSLVALRADIDNVLANPQPDDLRAIAADLRHSATAVVRPLSHAVYARGSSPATPWRPLRFLAAIVRTQPFRPVLVSLLYIATALPRNVEEYGFAAALPALALDVVFILIILGGANLLMRRWSLAHTWIYVGTLIVIHIIPLLLVVPGVVETDPQDTGLGVVVEIIASLALLLGTSSLGLLQASRESVLDAMQKELGAQQRAAIDEALILAVAARELGASLHGPVQSAVLASAAALEQAAAEGTDTTRAHSVLVGAAAAIDAALQTDGVLVDEELVFLLADVVEPWREICPVTLTLSEDVSGLRGPHAEAVTAIVREAIANAYRHGQATHVNVDIAGEVTAVVVSIKDDGIGLGLKQWGLGLTLIDRSTGGRWTLTREGDETVLSAQVPQ